MNRLIITYFTICILLCVTFSSSAQTLAKQADSLVSVQQWQSAALLYERVIFEGCSSDSAMQMLLNKALCYKQLKQYEQAQQTFQRNMHRTLNDTLLFRFYYQWALCCYLSGNFDEGASQLAQLGFFVSDSTLKVQSLLLSAYIFNELQKWNDARQAAIDYIQHLNLPMQQRDSICLLITNLYNNPPKLKNVTTARWLSIFLPGVGHTYAGAFFEGVASVLLQLTFIAIGVYEVHVGYYLTAYFIGANLWQRFYFGGVERADFLVKRHNYKHTRKFADEVKQHTLPYFYNF